MQPRTMKNLPRPSFWPLAIALCVATVLFSGPTGAVDISASKYQGGTTNAPYKTENAPSLFPNPLKWIFGTGTSAAMKRVQAPPNFKVDLSIEPKQYIPSTNLPLRVRMTVHNQGKDKYILDFKSAQQYEFIIRDKAGQDIYRSSQDKEFAQVETATVVNRNEKLVFQEELFGGETSAPLNLAPGAYTLVGRITSKQPVSAEAAFQVGP